MTEPATEPAERRGADHLSFDPGTGRLALGRCERTIASAGGNPAVLRAYVEVVESCRGTRPNRLVEVRDSDLDALATALDLEATDLRQQLESVLGLSPQVSTRLLSILQQRRLFLRVAAAAAGAAVVGSLAMGAADPARAAPVDAPSRSSAPADQVVEQPDVDGPLVVDEDGTGLIPPVEVEADGTVLIPPAVADQEPSGD